MSQPPDGLNTADPARGLPAVLRPAYLGFVPVSALEACLDEKRVKHCRWSGYRTLSKAGSDSNRHMVAERTVGLWSVEAKMIATGTQMSDLRFAGAHICFGRILDQNAARYSLNSAAYCHADGKGAPEVCSLQGNP